MNKLFRHAQILTADPNWNYFQDGAMLVSGGQIIWIGNDMDWENSPSLYADTEFDLKGKTIIPGLINTHSHGGLSIYRGLCDDGDLFSWAKTISSKTSFVDDEMMEIGNYLALMEQVSCGTTCTCDCNRYGTGIFARAASIVGIRSLSGTLVNSPELRPIGKPNWPSALYETEAAMEEFAGSEQTRFFIGAHSTYSCTGALIIELKREAERLGLPFNIHVSETKNEVEMCLQNHNLRPIIWLDQLGVLDSSFIVDHAVWVNEEEIEIISKNKCSISHCPVSNSKLGSGIAPIVNFLKAGVSIGLGTDSMLSNNSQDLFSEMKFAVLLQRAHTTDGFILSAREAIKMATIEAARTLGWQNEIGSLEVGKKADFCVLDLPAPKNSTLPYVESDIVYAGGRHLVKQVFCDGEIIYNDGQFTRFDREKFFEKLNSFYSRR